MSSHFHGNIALITVAGINFAGNSVAYMTKEPRVMSQIITRALRGNFLDVRQCVETKQQLVEQTRYIEDGLLLLNGGHIVWYGSWQEGKEYLTNSPQANGLRIDDYRDKLIVPGFIDSHLHYPQAEMVAAFGEQLLDWLDRYTFPTEQKYHDNDYAREMAQFFLEQLLRNGTTTAMVFGSVHPQSIDALFRQASNINMRLIAGKVMMDRHAPDGLLETVQQSVQQTHELIMRWHNHQRLSYALTPRFAPSCSREMLAAVQTMRQAYPDLYLQTHLSENRDELDWVKRLFPEFPHYLGIYHHFGLTGKRSIFAHCLHLSDSEWQCLHETNSRIAFCPTSNLFLGSGLFDLEKVWQHDIALSIGTDIGAGTTFNMLETLADAYKIAQLRHYRLSPFEAFYHATLGGAKALDIDDKVGNFTPGKEADLVVLQPAVGALQQLRQENSQSLEEKLFALMMLGDDRNIFCTLVDGDVVYQRDSFAEKTTRALSLI
jgi:guanine deaminase